MTGGEILGNFKNGEFLGFEGGRSLFWLIFVLWYLAFKRCPLLAVVPSTCMSMPHVDVVRRASELRRFIII